MSFTADVPHLDEAIQESLNCLLLDITILRAHTSGKTQCLQSAKAMLLGAVDRASQVKRDLLRSSKHEGAFRLPSDIQDRNARDGMQAGYHC